MADFTTIFSVLLGGGILGFVQFLITRKDNRQDNNKEILDRLNALDEKVDKIESSLDERDAVLARTHILRFKDEIYNNGATSHSQEYFEQTLDDIQTYNQFCAENPRFANGRTKAASKYIQEEYDRLYKEHKL